MRLLLFRHAEAVWTGGDVSSDWARHLTPGGRTHALRCGESLASLGERIDVILTSPLSRAVQTAELMARSFDAPVQTSSTLEPESRLSRFIDRLEALAPASTVLAVGHEPLMSEWSALLLGTPGPPRAYTPGAGFLIEFSGEIRPGNGRAAFYLGARGMERL